MGCHRFNRARPRKCGHAQLEPMRDPVVTCGAEHYVAGALGFGSLLVSRRKAASSDCIFNAELWILA
jgi:hypothetical protein